ncbi:MAG: basic amino acid/polyamine antiporter, family [Solirubrobacteraceae bacterium]|jgi:APA family basic amino acid/polyamine antiporter|nr:basic amino acid/polyamine antiporter, family [Solirubrobacteraceae bacterium]MEA2359895.1 basic amino acid/polyamine antiporter, family [Solirubrobacteraceae bacterium]
MAERRLQGLQRVLGVNALFATAYGNVGSSIYYALGLVASFALGLTPIVFIITGIIFFWTAATYAEATAMYPEAGGSSSFARRAFNEFWSFFAAWGQMLNYVITIAISSFFVPHYLGGVLGVDALRHSPADIFFGIGVVVVLSAVNVVGVRESAGVNVALALTDFATQVLLVIVGAFLVLSPSTLVHNVHLGVAPEWKDFFLAIPIGMIAYTGIETISNMAEEAKDETKTIPAAINRVVVAVFAIYAALPAVALSALPVVRQPDGTYVTKLGLPEEKGGFAGDPILGVVKALHLGPLQGAGEVYVGLLAATILFIASNAGIIGVSRLVYSMGLHRQVPDRMRQLHPRYGTPWIGILLFGAIACLTMLPGKADFLGNMYAFGAMLSFTIAHLSVIRLRLKYPDIERPYLGPGNITIAGRKLPLFAVLGGMGTGLAFVVVTVLHLAVAAAGIGWLAFGLFLYVWYRHRQGLDLTSTVKVAIPKPVVDHEAEYDSILVALEAKQYTPNAMATAIKVAARRRRGIHVLVTITVPASAPIDAELPEQELAAQTIIEQAKLQGGRRVTGHWEKVRAGGTGRLIVDEAREMEARAIVLPLPARTGSTVFGKTVETVLAERPCRVIIQADPEIAAPPAAALVSPSS